MSTNQVEIKERRFKNKGSRLIVTNKLLIIGVTIFYIIFPLLAIYEKSKGLASDIYTIFVVLGCIVFAITNWIVYINKPSSDKIYYIVNFAYSLIYILIFIIGRNEYVQFTVIAVLICGLLYYDCKFMAICTVAVALINTVHIILNYNSSGFNELETIKYLFMLCILYSAFRVTHFGQKYNHDAVYSAVDEQKMQKIILDEVLEIASVIQKGTTLSNDIVDELGKSAGIMNNTVSEISLSTQVTAENIQEQTIMTQSIQESINDTVHRSKKMVEIADSSSITILDVFNIMGDLKNQSQIITETNANVIRSMNQLQEKTNEVQNIANIIFSISSQTNLLALNASIESARAGEAGKGFAVVADQIRQLAEQTRKSTENITSIIKELNENAETATATVKESIVAADYQGGLISTASTNFENVNKNVSELSDDISAIDKMLIGLSSANNTIVENISQLSATTEEITASAQDSTVISENNLKDSKKAMELLKEVIETSYRLNKYMK